MKARRTLLRLLLYLYPRDFGETHGRELVELDAHMKRGVLGSIHLLPFEPGN